MLKKMRWRFVKAAMAAFSAVILLLLGSINIWNYTTQVNQQDRTLMQIHDFTSDSEHTHSSEGMPMPGTPGQYSPEVQFMIRFFAVYCDSDNQVLSINQDHISSISVDDATSFASTVLNKDSEKGFYKGYRYMTFETDEGTVIFFLNSERELQSMQSLLILTSLVAGVCLLVVFLLIIIFSVKAISPYVRNIETQKRFITDAGHELKTPLTSISTSAEVLAMEHSDDEWVQNIQKQSSHLSKLIANLIILSRLDEEQPFPNTSEFSLSDVAWELTESFESIAVVRGKEFIKHIENNLTITGNKDSIGKMMSILLDNAIKYSDEHGKIRLDVCRKHNSILIQVYNTCELSSKLDMTKLFDRFYRLDESHSKTTGGTGIGLSVAKAVVSSHGGIITAKAHGNSSITFTVKLHP